MISGFVARAWTMCRSFCNSFAIWRRTSARRMRSPRRKNSSLMFYSVNDRRQKFFWRLKESYRSGSRFTFTIFPPGSRDPGFTWKICSLSRKSGAKVMVARCL